MLTHRGYHRHGSELPLTRASQVTAHADTHMKAAEFAQRALRRFDLRNRRLSWEERALETNVFAGSELVSYELLSGDAVALHADELGVGYRAAIRAARDDGARIFAVGRREGCVGPVLMAVVDEAPDGALSVRTVLSSAPPNDAALDLLDRHMAAATPDFELSCSPGM